MEAPSLKGPVLSSAVERSPFDGLSSISTSKQASSNPVAYAQIEEEILHMQDLSAEITSLGEACADLELEIWSVLVNRVESLQDIEDDTPGPYYICARSAAVTEDPSPDSLKVADLSLGTDVNVLELLISDEDGRYLARIESPAGWIALESALMWERVAVRHPSPGRHFVVESGTVVSQALSVDSPAVAELAFGATVVVEQVVHCPEQRRIRGRICRPQGWISLVDTRIGYHLVWRRSSPEEEEAEGGHPGTHAGITCDRCESCPIVGMRYKCKRRRNYDLCEACRAEVSGSSEDWLEIRALRPPIRNATDLALAIFYRGWSLILLRELATSGYMSCITSRARHSLEQVCREEALDEEHRHTASWLLGNLLLDTGDSAEAKQVFERVLAERPCAEALLGMSRAVVSLVGPRAPPDEKLSVLSGVRSSLYKALELDDMNARVYEELNTLLEALGEAHEARQLAATCIRKLHHDVWDLVVQRPTYRVPGLLAQPWHAACDHDAARHLAGGLAAIRAELLDFAEDERTVWYHFPPNNLVGDTMDVKVLMGMLPGWVQVFAEEEQELDDLDLHEPNPSDDGKAECPMTSELLLAEESIVEASRAGIGNAVIARLAPGAQLLPRCGCSNARLTCIAALMEAEDGGCCVHVADERPRRVSPQDGIMVFDDSFEHSLINTSELQACIFLMVQFWHPDVPSEDWELHGRFLCPPHEVVS